MKGQVVVVKDVSGIPLVRKIWDENAFGVFIHDEEQWDNRYRGRPFLEPVGFPFDSVFLYDASMEAEIKMGKVDWEQLIPYGVSR